MKICETCGFPDNLPHGVLVVGHPSHKKGCGCLRGQTTKFICGEEVE